MVRTDMSLIPGGLYRALSDMIGDINGNEIVLRKNTAVMFVSMETFSFEITGDGLKKIKVLYKGSLFVLETILPWWKWFENISDIEAKEIIENGPFRDL